MKQKLMYDRAVLKIGSLSILLDCYDWVPLNGRGPRRIVTSCWCIFAGIPKTRKNIPNWKTFANMAEHTS